VKLVISRNRGKYCPVHEMGTVPGLGLVFGLVLGSLTVTLG